ncbi:hypothetical protein OG756_42260 (plasmid) [Streptomyces sp. NBC_01310]|uniref:hypothetical protein n=1 Tax=Streptomyces sp. NBC_01310 TaxID=2903820 RepID=UPI0035B62925|nr:hypothetical protein OG756_42260 [Streptomyces sp. NBC_01310]
MSVRKTVGLNQSDSSSVKAIPARFDRFGRGFSDKIAVPAGAESGAHGGVRFDGYTVVMTNMPLLTLAALTGTDPVTGVPGE